MAPFLRALLSRFMARKAVSLDGDDRVLHLFESRGYDIRTVRAVVPEAVFDLDVLEARRKLEALSQLTGSTALLGVAACQEATGEVDKAIASRMSTPPIVGVPRLARCS